MTEKRVVVVSDTHNGSFYGLLPPEFITYEGVPKLQNAGQEFLWECWLHFVNCVEEFSPHAVILNGDIIDGPQRKQHGAELSLPDARDQRRAAIATLKVLRSVTRKAKWYATQGTPYHVGHFGDAEEDIAEAMGCTPYPSVGAGNLCREVLRLDVDGVILEAAHHIGFAPVNRSMPLERELRAAWAEPADLMIRSHVHYHKMVDNRAVTTPCWQLQTRFGRKSSVHHVKPSIGGTYIRIDPSAKKRGHTPCQVDWELYQTPALPVVKL